MSPPSRSAICVSDRLLLPSSLLHFTRDIATKQSIRQKQRVICPQGDDIYMM
jgi:hypothetical protein